MIPLIVLISSIMGMLCACRSITKEKFPRMARLVLFVNAVVFLYTLWLWISFYQQEAEDIKEYKTIQLEMSLVCPGINTEYEANAVNKKLFDIRKKLKNYAEINKTAYEYWVPDVIDKLHIITVDEINECSRLKTNPQ